MEANSMYSEGRTLIFRDQNERRLARFSWPAILGLVGTALFLIGLAAVLLGHSDGHGGGSFLSPSAVGVRSMMLKGPTKRPPWQVIQNVKPAGPDKDVGISIIEEPANTTNLDKDCAGGPSKNMNCTLIILFEINTPGYQIQEIANQYEEADPQISLSMDVVMMHYGNNVDRCCSSYKKLMETEGVASIEFDAMMHVAGKDSWPTKSPPWWVIHNVKLARPDKDVGTSIIEEPANTTNLDKDCAGGPPKNMNCTLIILFETNTSRYQIQEIANQYEEADPQISRSMDVVMMHYGNNFDKCCSSYKKLMETEGVASIEFDAMMHITGKDSWHA